MEPTIDTGSILARKKYPLPPADIDIDNLYDTAIRADLLVDVLLGWYNNRTFVSIKQQTNNSTNNYFVIHPLLKHLALLSLDK